MKKLFAIFLLALFIFSNTVYFSGAVNTDGSASNWTREKAAHLARSVLLSVDKNTIDALYSAGSAGAAVDMLFPDVTGPDRTNYNTFITNYTSSGFNWGDGNHAMRLYQLQYALDPYEAKKKLFSLFEDIFSVNVDSGKGIGYKDIGDQQNLLYTYTLGNYQTLIKKIIYNNGQPGDFAEGAFLDLFNQDTPDNPNENYARELLQLFMMGEYEPFLSKENNDVRNYEETDVKALARLLTGLKSDSMTHAITFDSSKHYTGASLGFLTGTLSIMTPVYYTASGTIDPTLITQSINGNNGLTDNIVEYIFAKRSQQIALFLADRLFRFYIDDHPTRTDLDMIAKNIVSNNFEMLPVVKYVLTLDVMYSDASMNDIHYKNPLELGIGTIKLLQKNSFTGIIADQNIYDTSLLRRLGWTPYFPGSVFGRDGFDDSLKWSSTSNQNAWMSATNYFTYRTSGSGIIDFRLPLGNYRKELTTEIVPVVTSMKNVFTGSLVLVSGVIDTTAPVSLRVADLRVFTDSIVTSGTGGSETGSVSNTGSLSDSGTSLSGTLTNTGTLIDTGMLIDTGILDSTGSTGSVVISNTGSSTGSEVVSSLGQTADTGSSSGSPSSMSSGNTDSSGSISISSTSDVSTGTTMIMGSDVLSFSALDATGGSIIQLHSGTVSMLDFSVVTDAGTIVIYSGSYDAGLTQLTISSGSLVSSGSTTPIYSGSIVFQNGSKVTTDTISSDSIIQAYEDIILVDKRLPLDTHTMVKNFLETNESGSLIPIAPSNTQYYDTKIRGLLSILLSQPEYVLLRGWDAPTILDSTEQHFLDSITGKLFFIELYGGDDYLSSVVPKDEYSTYVDYRTNESGSIALPLSNLVDIGNFYINSALATGSGTTPGFKSLFDQGYLKIFNRVGSYRHSQDHDAAARQITSYENTTDLSAEGVFGHLVEREFESSHTISLGAKRPNVYRGGHYINMGGSVILNNPMNNSLASHMNILSQISQTRNYPSNTRDLFKDAGRISDIAKISLNQGGPSGANGDMNNIFRFAKVLMNNNIGRSYYLGGYGGYDTHGDQYNTLNNNLRFVGDAVSRFFSEVKDTQDVTIVIFSEFGRTNKVNGSLGTDHGDGGGMFVLTSNPLLRSTLSAGTYGNMSIKDAKANSLGVGVDYRSVYGSIFKGLYNLDGATYFRDPTVSLDNDVSLAKNEISLLSYAYQASGNNVVMRGSFHVSGQNYNPGKAGYTQLNSGTGLTSMRETNIHEIQNGSGYDYTFQIGSRNQPYFSIDSFSNQYALTNISGILSGSQLPMIIGNSSRNIATTGSSLLPLFQGTLAPVLLSGSGVILHNSLSGGVVDVPSSNVRFLFSSGITNVNELTSSSGNLSWNGGFILGELVNRDVFVPSYAILQPENTTLDRNRIARIIKLGADTLGVGMKLSRPMRIEFTSVPTTEKYRVITSEDGVNWSDLEGSGSEYQRNASGSIIVTTNHLSFFGLLAQTPALPPPTCTVSVSPSTVYNNTPVTLSWNIVNTQTGLLQPLAIVVGSSGSQSLTPPQNSTTTYTVSVQNVSGLANCSAQVTTIPSPQNPLAAPGTILGAGGPIQSRMLDVCPDGDLSGNQYDGRCEPGLPSVPGNTSSGKNTPIVVRPVTVKLSPDQRLTDLISEVQKGNISRIDSSTEDRIRRISYEYWKSSISDKSIDMKALIASFLEKKRLSRSTIEQKMLVQTVHYLDIFSQPLFKDVFTPASQEEVIASEGEYKYVQAEKFLTFRKNPVISASNILGYLARNTPVTVISDSGSWTKIFHDGIQGFVKSIYLRDQNLSDTIRATGVPSFMARKGQISVYSAYVRSVPDIDGKQVGNLSEGTGVYILDELSDWYEILYADGKKGYVKKELVL